MDWRDSVKAVRRAAAAGQLVIFVGSGVSANSGLPTWKEMILQIAERLPADFNSDAPFNPDTYLRIPEYLYEQDLSPNHQYYYQTIGEILSSDAPANPIDDLIFDIRPPPHHHDERRCPPRALGVFKHAALRRRVQRCGSAVQIVPALSD